MSLSEWIQSVVGILGLVLATSAGVLAYLTYRKRIRTIDESKTLLSQEVDLADQRYRGQKRDLMVMLVCVALILLLIIGSNIKKRPDWRKNISEILHR